MEVATNPNKTNTFPNNLPLHIYKFILLFIILTASLVWTDKYKLTGHFIWTNKKIIRQSWLGVWLLTVGNNRFMRYQIGRNVTLFTLVIRRQYGKWIFAWQIIVCILPILLNCTDKVIIWHLSTNKSILKITSQKLYLSALQQKVGNFFLKVGNKF